MNCWVFGCSIHTMAVASIQRYILIFHRNFMNTPVKHYLPFLLPPVLLFIWYIALIFFYPCEQHFDNTQLWCGGSCYSYYAVSGSINWITTCFIPILLTLIFNVLLLLRMVHQKFKMQRHRSWRKTRKLTIQLVWVSFLFLTIYLPYIIFALIRLWIDPSFLSIPSMTYLAYTLYLVPLLMPFICLMVFPQIMTELKKCCCYRYITMRQRRTQQTIVPIHSQLRVIPAHEIAN